MLASEPGRTVLYSGASRFRSLLYCVVVILLVLLQDPVICEEAQCRKSTLREHLRKSFKVLKLGRARNVKSCINLCCSAGNCDLALLRRTRCYGISCSHHDLCRGILNGLREKRHEISKRSIVDADDVPSDFSHHPRYHGVCNHRRVVPHHVFIEGGRGVSIFRKLATDVGSSRECNQYCCKRADCSLAFIMREKCYGVICPNDGDCESSEEARVPLHLEVALLQRRESPVETSRIQNSELDNDSSFRVQGRSHYRHQEDSDKDDTSNGQEDEPELPRSHHLHDFSRASLHHHHHHRHHKSTGKPEEITENPRQRSTHKLHHKNRNLRQYRHHHRRVNGEPTKPKGRHLNKDMESIDGVNHDSEEGDNANQNDQDETDLDKENDDPNRNTNRRRSHHKSARVHLFVSNEDERDTDNDNHDGDNDMSTKHTKKRKMHHKRPNIDSMESVDDERNSDVSLKKRRKHKHHNVDSSSESDWDREEELRSHRKKKAKLGHHYHHENQDSSDHENIMEFDDKDTHHVSVNEEKEHTANQVFKHEQEKHDESSYDDDENGEMNSDQENGSEEESGKRYSKGKHRYKSTSVEFEEERSKPRQKHYHSDKNSSPRKSRMRNKEREDVGEDDESPNKKDENDQSDEGENPKDQNDNDQSDNSHEAKSGSDDRNTERKELENDDNDNDSVSKDNDKDENHNVDEKQHYDREGRIQNKRRRHKSKSRGKEQHYDDEEMMNDKDVLHESKRKKTDESRKDDYTDSNDEADDNKDDDAEMEEERKTDRMNKIVDGNHHHHNHHHNHHEDENEGQSDKNTKIRKQEKKEQTISSDVDISESEDTNDKINEDDMNGHRHQKNSKKKHHKTTDDAYRQSQSEEQEDSGSGSASDMEDIMSQDHDNTMYKPNGLHRSHSIDKEDTPKKHHRVNNNDKPGMDNDCSEDEDKEFLKKKSYEVFKNNRHETEENNKRKTNKIVDKKNGDDYENERNKMGNEEDKHVRGGESDHHESDKDNKLKKEEDTVRNKENKMQSSKPTESLRKKSNHRIRQPQQEYDEIKDNDSKGNSKKSDKNEKSDFDGHGDNDEIRREHKHRHDEKSNHLREESMNVDDNDSAKSNKNSGSMKMSKERVNGDGSDSNFHREKDTKENSVTKGNENDESKEERKSKETFVKEDSRKKTKQSKKSDLKENIDDKKAKHNRKNSGKIRDDTESSTHSHRTNINRKSKEVKYTNDHESEVDDSDNNDDENNEIENHGKETTDNEHKEKHRTEKLNRRLESRKRNENDNKGASKTDDGAREKSVPKRKENNFDGHRNNGSMRSKEDFEKHFDTSHSAVHEKKEQGNREKSEHREDFAHENEDASADSGKGKGHRESKSKGNKKNGADEISSNHVHDVDDREITRNVKNRQGTRKENDKNVTKNTNIDADDTSVRDHQWKVGRKNNTRNKDTNGIRRDHVYHVTHSSVEKKLVDGGNHTEEYTGSLKSTDEKTMKDEKAGEDSEKKTPKKDTTTETTPKGNVENRQTNYRKLGIEDKSQSSDKQRKTVDSKISQKNYNNGNDKSKGSKNGSTEKDKEQKAKVGIETQNVLNNTGKTNINNLPLIGDNTDKNNIQGVIKKPYKKHNTWKTSDRTNTGYSSHKPSLYHSLNELKSIENNTTLISEDKSEGIVPEESSEHDIMESNQNDSAKQNVENPSLTEESKGDKTKFFNQETSEWKESFQGDNVDESGKFFNQRTRDWTERQPKANTEYFHNLTSQWNIQNKTKTSDFGKYFNQRIQTWIGNKVNNTQQNSNTNAHTIKSKINHILNIHGSIKNKLQDTKGIIKDNQRKHKESPLIYKHEPKHKIQNTSPALEKPPPPQVIHNNTQDLDQFNHLKTSNRVRTKMTKNVTIMKNQPHKLEDTESAKEKVKNEILKLIGETPSTVTAPQKKTHNIDNLFGHKHKKTSARVLNYVNKSLTGKPETIPRTYPKNFSKTITHYYPKQYESHTLGNERISVKKYSQVPKRQKGLKTSKTDTKVKAKESLKMKRPHGKLIHSLPATNKGESRTKSVRKQKIGPLLKQPKTIKPKRPSQPLAIPISRPFKQPKIGYKPITQVNINSVSPTTLPYVNADTWKGTFHNLFVPTQSSIQNWNRQNNVFDNEWENQKWNSYYTYTKAPTERPTISWNGMAWNSKRNTQANRISGYPNGRMVYRTNGVRPTSTPVRYGGFPLNNNGDSSTSDTRQNDRAWNTARLLRPTLGPIYRQRGFPSIGNGGLGTGNRNQGDGQRATLVRPTAAPPYKPREFPSTQHGYTEPNGQDHRNQNDKIVDGGSSQFGSSPIRTTTPRRNYVYNHQSKDQQKTPTLPQNHVMKQPIKPTAPQPTRSHPFVQQFSNITSLPLEKNAPNQHASTNKNYLKQNEVNQGPTTTPAKIKILKNPIVPHRKTSKSKQWNQTWTTTGIHQPFKVNKIERLYNETRKKDQQHPTLPKGCYPGEIMSEMTLENGLDAGNYTNLGRTEIMDSCISKCCEMKGCEVAVQMDNICFGLKCHSKESCKIKTTLGKSSHHKLCFISRKKKERQSIFDFDNDILGEQDVCHEEQAVGLKWKTTNAGSFDEIPCPKKAKGIARRKCSIESHWLLPDFSSCVTSEYEELYERSKRLVNGEDSSSLLQSLAVVTTRTIDNSLIFGGDLKKATEIMTSIVQEQGTKVDGWISHKNVKNYLITCSNLLDDSNKQEWRNIQRDARGSADILRDSQTYVLLASSKRPETQANVTYVTNNIVVQVSYQEKGSQDKTFPNYTNQDVAMWDGEKDNVKIPASVFSIGNMKVVTFSYRTLPALLPVDANENLRHSEPNSKILATIVEPRIQDKITPAVTITLHHLKQNRINPRCVYWDFNMNPNQGGAWSTEGCRLESSDKERTVCRCDHLANFAVLMDVVDTGSMQVSNKDVRYSKEMAAMWICIPVLVVLIIAALYIASTWSRSPRRRTLNEKSSLLRSSVTTDEVRYDYLATPSHNLEGTTPKNFKELEWQKEFDEHLKDGHEMEQDSGIESNDHDDSSTHCDLSLSQENLEHYQDHLEDTQSPQSDTFEYMTSHLTDNETFPVNLDTNSDHDNQNIHLDAESRY